MGKWKEVEFGDPNSVVGLAFREAASTPNYSTHTHLYTCVWTHTAPSLVLLPGSFLSQGRATSSRKLSLIHRSLPLQNLPLSTVCLQLDTFSVISFDQCLDSYMCHMSSLRAGALSSSPITLQGWQSSLHIEGLSKPQLS